MESGGDCAHERSHVVDSRFFGDSYSTPESRRIFCDVCRMQRWLDVEAVLARCQSQLGVIPPEAAVAITDAAHIGNLDMAAVATGIKESGHSLVSLLAELQRAAGAHGEFVHYGATTQDIEDTAQSLEMREVLGGVDALLTRIVSTLARLSAAHASTPMVGRTHAQPALPITFGLKTAGWLDELLRHAERLQSLRSRVLVAQLGGGAGTMAGFGPQATELLSRVACALSLAAPRSPWHTARDRVAEFATALAMLAATLGRLADEVRTLSRPEIGEVEEAWVYGRVGSSTMPHKRNPDISSQVVAVARIAKAQVALALDGMVQEHERDSRGLRLEWVSVAEVSHCVLVALDLVDRLLRGLRVDVDRMGENLCLVGDLLCTERLMLALGADVGKQTAHQLVYDLTQSARESGLSLKAVLTASPEVSGLGDDIEALFDPTTYLGSSAQIVDAVVDAAARWLATKPSPTGP